MADPRKNFSYGRVSVAPSSTTSGTTLSVTNADAAQFLDPAVDGGAYNVTIWPANQIPLSSNSEIVRVTAKGAANTGGSGQTQLTITRTQEGTSPRAIQIGDQIAQTITKKTLDDITSDAIAPDATTTSKGIVQLAGDLGGTAASPTVPTKVNKSGDTMTGTLNVPTLNTTISLVERGDASFGRGTYTDPAAGVGYDAKFGGSGNGIVVAGASKFNAGLDVSSNKITSVATPIATTDAANKSYVDAAVSGNIFNATKYGVVADGRQVSDGAITAGTASLTSSTAAFTVTDVGKSVMVTGAGSSGNGHMLNTTISAYVSANQVTLTANATVTVSAARIVLGSNNTTALQSALTAAAGKGIVELPAGYILHVNAALTMLAATGMRGQGIDSTYLIGGGINATSNDQFVTDMTIDVNNNSFYSAITSKGQNHLYRRLSIQNWGNFGIDFAYDSTLGGSVDGWVEDSEFNHNALNAVTGGMIIMEGSYRNIHIQNNVFGNNLNQGNTIEVYIGGSSVGSTEDNVGLYIEGNDFKGQVAKSGYLLGRHIRVRDNIFRNSIQLSSGTDGTVAYTTRDVEFSGNTMQQDQHTASDAILYLSTSTSASDSGVLEDIRIFGNQFENAHLAVNAVSLTSGTNTLRALQIYDNKFRDSTIANIFLGASGIPFVIDRLSVHHNDFFNWLSSGSGTYAAFQISAYTSSSASIAISNSSVDKNTFTATRTGLTKAIYLQASNSATLSGTLNLRDNIVGSYTVTSDVAGILTSQLDVAGSKITSLATPTSTTDAANKAYVDSLISGDTLISAATQTASFTAVAQNYYPVDATVATRTVTLPTSTSGQQLAIKRQDATYTVANLVNITGTINGATTTLPLRLNEQGKVFVADATGGWNVYAGDMSLAALDNHYQPVFNVKQYGAKGDGIKVTDAAITTGTNQLSSSSAGFTNAAVGKYVVVVGAGASAASLTATINSVSSGVATLSTNASTTVSGAVMAFGTDDGSAIQSAINQAQLTGARAYAPAGNYMVVSTINKDASNITLFGDGIDKTIFINGSSANGTLFNFGNGAGPTIRSNITCQDFSIDIMTTRTFALSASWCSNVLFQRVKVFNPGSSAFSMMLVGLFSNQSAGFLATDITLEECVWDYGGITSNWEAVTLNYARRVNIINCVGLNKVSGSAALLNYNSEDVKVIGGYYYKFSLQSGGRGPLRVVGATYESSAIKLQGQDNVNITGGTIFKGYTSDSTASAGVGIIIQGYYYATAGTSTETPYYITSVPYAWSCKNINVTGCIFDMPNTYGITAGITNFSGNYVIDCEEINFSNNTIRNAEQDGLHLFATYMQIVDNKVYNSGQTGINGARNNFFLGASYGIFSNNQSYDNQGTATAQNDVVFSNENSTYFPTQSWQVAVNQFNLTGAYSYYNSGFTTTKPSNFTFITPGSGNVTGPTSSTTNAIATYNGTTGQIIQNSNATVTPAGGIVNTIPIGGNTPALTVTQNDTTNNPYAIGITNNGTGAGINVQQSAAGPAVQISDSGTNTSLRITKNATGAVITATRNQTNGNAAMVVFSQQNASDPQDAVQIKNLGTGSALLVNTQDLSVKNGMVGIGKVTPTTALDVNGTITGIAGAINQTASANGLTVTQTGNTGTTTSTQGAIFLNNTGNTGLGLTVYSNQASAVAPLTSLVGGASFTYPVLAVVQNGTGSAMTVTTSTGVTGAGLNFTDNSTSGSFAGIYVTSARTSQAVEFHNSSTGAVIKAAADGTGRGIVVTGNATNNALQVSGGNSILGGTGTANSTLQVAGSFSTNTTTVTAATTLDATYSTLLSNSTSALTHTLPTAVGITGRRYIITNINTGVVTIATTSSQTISGVTTLTLNAQFAGAELQSDGANWQIIATNANQILSSTNTWTGVNTFSTTTSLASVKYGKSSRTAATTLSSTSALYELCDGTSGAFAITLPTAAGNAGLEFFVKKVDSTTNAITVNTTSSQTIDGVATYTLATQYKYCRFTSDGANWMITGNN